MEDQNTIFAYLGGEVGVRALVDSFYDQMMVLPEAEEILAMHPPPLSDAREKLFLFLVGWFGGPPLYIERYGHPRLRARHLPFEIDSRARDAWMSCMSHALKEAIPDQEIRLQLEQAFYNMADFMRNRPDREA